jgi:hypothetical protein
MAAAIWWLTSLRGLPDIGDPFDVAAFREFTIPDDENAFTVLRRAQEKLTPVPRPLPSRSSATPKTTSWSTADPKLREWVEANREALDLFLAGAAKADGIAHPAGESYSLGHPFVDSDTLIWLALLEAGRRQEAGDMAGAWQCYRAILRTTTHIRRHGSFTQRFFANRHHDKLRTELATWSADRRTSIPQLRRALDEAIATRPEAQWDAFALKVAYLDVMRSLERPIDIVHRGLDEKLDYRIGGIQVPADVSVYLFASHRFFLREPERSKRVARLIYANWLAHVEAPGAGSRMPALRASYSQGNARAGPPLFAVSAGAPAAARLLSLKDIAAWAATTRDLSWSLEGWDWTTILRKEKTGYGELVVSLAQELYLRERGSPPPSKQALVGTYLDRLPDDGSDDLDDGTKPANADQ